jgi:hypothetical protein
MKKYIYITIALMMVGIVTATAIVGIQNKSLRAERNTLKAQTQQQAEIIKRLAEMEAVSLSIKFEVKNTAVLGSIKNGDYKPLLEGALQYTRREVMKNQFTNEFERADSLFNIEHRQQIEDLYPTKDEINKMFIPIIPR